MSPSRRSTHNKKNSTSNENPPARVIPMHTVLPGRARLKVSGLRRSEAVKQHIEDQLSRLPGIRHIQANPLTGNVLICFDLEISLETVVEALQSTLRTYPPYQPHAEKPRELSLSGVILTLLSRLWKRSERRADPAPPKVTNSAPKPMMPWHTLDAANVLARLDSVATTGLASAAAAERLSRYGPNALPPTRRRSALGLFIAQFTTPPVALLGASAIVAVATGGLLDAAAIGAVVLINAVIGFITEQKAEQIIASLDKAPPPAATLLRDGRPSQALLRNVVIGDILLLSPGSYVAADARLLAGESLSLDESTLTGESMPVQKYPHRLLKEETPLADRENMVYTGTIVTGGSGTAVVVATGQDTEMGLIQTMVGEARPPATPMERQLDQMGSQLALLSSAVCGGVYMVGLLRGYGWLAMLKASVSLAVAAVPEGLPTIATTTLALGIRDMRQRKVLIRQLNAVETLGSVQVFCLDKTGTLTMNRMAVVALYVGMQRVVVDKDGFSVSGMRLDSGDLEKLRHLFEAVALCSEAEVHGGRDEWVLNGTATENALLHMAIRAGIDVTRLRKKHPVVHMQYRSEECHYMVTIHRRPESGQLTAVKGSPAQVLALCHWYLADGERRPLTEQEREAILAENDTMAGETLRVLGVAFGHSGAIDALEKGELIWLGLVGMADPIRPGMDWLLARFHNAGIETVMITGDQSATAHAIGEQLGLSNGKPLEILDSTSLDKLDPELLAGVVRRVHVFSRVSPAHKLQIVQALQRADIVVAMTGDGINDGPALKAADLGVAMGGTGTDLARSVAEVVLEDDNLQTMVVAVRQGRTVYSNIRKALRFLLSTNFSEIEVMLAGIALGIGQPLNPMQLLWINLISDIFPGLALALEPAEPDILDRPPRDPEAPIIARHDLRRLFGESAVISGGALASYGYGVFKYGVGPRARTHAFMTLSLAQLLHSLSCRSEDHSLFDKDVLPANSYLDIALGVSLLAQLLTVLVPGLRKILGTTPLSLVDGLVIGAGAVSPLLINEATKKARRTSQQKGAEPPKRPPRDDTDDHEGSIDR